MLKKTFFFIICFIVLCVDTNNLFADATYKFSASIIDYNEGGKLYITNQEKSNPLFYFVKTSWVDENEIIYYWHGFNRKKTEARTINNAYIIDAIVYNSSLLLLIKEKNKISISLFDSTGNITNSQIIDTNFLYINSENTRWIQNNSASQDYFYFILVNKLFKLKINNKKFETVLISDDNIICARQIEISNSISSATSTSNNNSNSNSNNNNSNNNSSSSNNSDNNNNNNIVFIDDKIETGVINYVDNYENKQFIARINLTDETEIKQIQNYLVVLSSSKNQNATLLQFIDLETKNIINSSWIQAPINCIDFSITSNSIYALITEKNISRLVKIPIRELNNPENWKYTNLPINLFPNKKLKVTNRRISIFSENSIIQLDTNNNIILFDYIDLSHFLSTNIYLIELENKIIISTSVGSLTLAITKNSFWFINRQIKNTGGSIIYILLTVVLLFVYRIYRNQKRLLEALLDLPSAGFVFLINRSGKLVRTNEDGRKILGISPQMILKKQFSYYSNNEQNKPLAELIERGLVTRISFHQKINIQQNNISKEWFCSLIPLRNIAGRFRGIVLTGVDITEELEKKTLTNWAQLAHDMQTNLSTIRLNAEQIEADNENNEQRKKKIVYQVTILMQRIRDIVTVGRDDKLDKVTVNSNIFCGEVLQEFDFALFENINYELKVDDFNFICDKPKLIRCIRNAIENGIKSMKNNPGTITLSCRKDIHNVYISVKDTGEGMDEATKKKILEPFFSTARTEGGTGIGTMIMQRVAELHGGKLIIDSKKNEGTEITIQFPDMLRRKL